MIACEKQSLFFFLTVNEVADFRTFTKKELFTVCKNLSCLQYCDLSETGRTLSSFLFHNGCFQQEKSACQ